MSLERNRKSYGIMAPHTRCLWLGAVATFAALSLVSGLASAADRKHAKERIKDLLPPKIETTDVAKTMGLGPHPSDPEYGAYVQRTKQEFDKKAAIAN
jgi:hypothetical protein